MRTLLASFALCLLINASAHSQTVGMLGDWQKIEFEGLKEVDADDIRYALAGDLEYQAAARPSASLEKFLKIAEDRITQGFRHSGYVKANVEVGYDAGRDRVVALVDEGAKYTAGEIRVMGNDDIDPKRIAAAIKLTPQERVWSYTVNGKALGKPSGDEESDDWEQWKKFGGSPFSETAVSRMAQQVWIACADHGYPSIQPKLTPQIDDDAKTVDLQVEIDSKTGPALVGNVEIAGLTRHTNQEVLDFLKLRPGMRFSADLMDEICQKLRDSCRFWSFDVEVPVILHANRYGQAPKEVQVVIRVVEYTKVPTLSKPLSEVEEALRNSARWMENYGKGTLDDGDVELVSHERSPGYDYTLSLCVCPRRGWIASIHGKYAEMLQLSHCAVGEIGNSEIHNLLLGRKLTANDWIPTTYFQLRANRVEDGEFKTAFNANLKLNSSNSEKTAGLHFLADPVAMVHIAHRNGNTVALDEGILTIQNDPWRFRIDAESGRPIELSAKAADDSPLTLQCKLRKGAYEEKLREVRSRALSFRESYDANAPLHSLIRHIRDEILAQPAFDRNSELAQILVNRSELLLSPEFDEFISGVVDRRKDRTFKIPSMQGSSPKIGLEAYLYFPRTADRFFSRGSWPWTLAREAGLSLVAETNSDLKSGMGLELARVFNSTDAGPVSILLIAKYAKGNAQQSHHIGQAGLQRLSDDDFERDLAPFLNDDLWAPMLLETVAQISPFLSESEIALIKNYLPTATHAPLQKLVTRRKSQPHENPREALRAVLLECWQETWRDQLAAEFTRLANHPDDYTAQVPLEPYPSTGIGPNDPFQVTPPTPSPVQYPSTGLPKSLADPATASELWHELK